MSFFKRKSESAPAQPQFVSPSVGYVPPGFHVMLKPHGPACNLNCSYCFYLRKEELFEEKAQKLRMSDEVLEAFVRQYIEAQRVPVINFAWQGGEPTLMGLDHFRKAMELQQKYKKPGVQFTNSIQTNGVLLDEEWCRFLKQHKFLVGLSMDGPARLHDAHRVDKGGRPTFEKVHRAMKLLQAHGVDFNVLCVVNRVNAEAPLEVYRFLREQGVEFIQLIPALEAVEGKDGQEVTNWSVRPEQWGEFTCRLFDEWVRHDVGRIFVQHFDMALAAWVGTNPGVCVHSETCGYCLVMEHNGDLFSCDHFVTPAHNLGNILEKPLTQMVGSAFQAKFGHDKFDALPSYCRNCPVLFACNGACPKDRFARTPEGEPGLNYLCEGYRQFFEHVAPYMETMADLLDAHQPPAKIMELLRQREQPGSGKAGTPNAPCPCGSGRKFKNCCGRK